jgi:hypothetical protein
MLVANFILFQIAWFACVLGAAKAMPWTGVGVTFIILCWHFYHTKQAKAEIALMLAALFIGGVFDQSMLTSRLIEYQAHGWSNWLAPVWILALWLAFASTLNVSLAWMHGRHVVAMLFGATGGPLAYIAAEKIGAVTVAGSHAYITLAIGWGVITPLLVLAARHLNGYSTKAVS